MARGWPGYIDKNNSPKMCSRSIRHRRVNVAILCCRRAWADACRGGNAYVNMLIIIIIINLVDNPNKINARMA